MGSSTRNSSLTFILRFYSFQSLSPYGSTIFPCWSRTSRCRWTAPPAPKLPTYATTCPCATEQVFVGVVVSWASTLFASLVQWRYHVEYPFECLMQNVWWTSQPCPYIVSSAFDALCKIPSAVASIGVIAAYEKSKPA